MTYNDKEEIKEMLSTIISTYSAKTDGKFDLIKLELQVIKEQTTKTNGRVNKMEDKVEVLERDFEKDINIIHGKIRYLDNQETSSKAIKRFIYMSIITISTVIGIVIAIFQMVHK
jgi:hypothetical protein